MKLAQQEIKATMTVNTSDLGSKRKDEDANDKETSTKKKGQGPGGTRTIYPETNELTREREEVKMSSNCLVFKIVQRLVMLCKTFYNKMQAHCETNVRACNWLSSMVHE